MTEERDQDILEKSTKKLAHPRLLDYQWLKSQRIFDMLLVTLLILLIALFLFFIQETLVQAI